MNQGTVADDTLMRNPTLLNMRNVARYRLQAALTLKSGMGDRVADGYRISI